MLIPSPYTRAAGAQPSHEKGRDEPPLQGDVPTAYRCEVAFTSQDPPATATATQAPYVEIQSSA